MGSICSPLQQGQAMAGKARTPGDEGLGAWTWHKAPAGAHWVLQQVGHQHLHVVVAAAPAQVQGLRAVEVHRACAKALGG